MPRQLHGPLALLAAAWLAVIGLAGTSPGAEARTLRLVALGDSLTAGHGLPDEAGFARVLERQLRARGHDVAVANAGVSGDTASGGLDRLDWSVPDGTDGVIVELGANDMLRGLDPAVTKAALQGIIERLKARDIPVLLAGMRAARNLGPDYAARFDAIYPDLARAHNVPLYPFFLEGVAGERGLNLPDGMHPTAAGVERIVAAMLPSVEAFLARLKAPEAR